MLSGVAGQALAQAAATEAAQLEEVVVTAQKRSENLQDVPISIQALGSEKLDELQVSDVNDYVKFLPSVTAQTAAPGFSTFYMRGVASGENSNHSGPSPGNVSPRRTANPCARRDSRSSAAPLTWTRTNGADATPYVERPGAVASLSSRWTRCREMSSAACAASAAARSLLQATAAARAGVDTGH